MKAAMAKGASISAKAARARAYQAIRQSITPNMLATPNQLRSLGLARSRPSESKGMDTSLAISTPILATTNTNGDAIVLNLVQQGAGSWNRIGRKIFSKSLRLKGVAILALSPVATTSNFLDSSLRMVVVLDRQPSGGAIPTFDSIFGITAQDGTESSHVMAPPRFDNMERFRVLKDCTLEGGNLSPVTGGTQNITSVNVPFDEYIKLPNIETVFAGQSAPMTIADISTGALYVYFRSTLAVDDKSDWTIAAFSSARLRFADV